MYQNSVALPREDLGGALRSQDSALGEVIAHKLLPPFPVKHKSATMPTLLSTNDQIIDIKHAPKTAYQQVQATLGDESYNCEEAGIEVPLSAEDYNVLGQDEAEAIASAQGRDIVLRGREQALATILMGADCETLFAGQITNPVSAENWNEAGGKPIDDVADADDALGLRIGEGRRTLVISQTVLTYLRKNEQIRAEYRRIVGQTDASATNRKIGLDVLASLLGVDEILVGSARKNTANKGQEAVQAYIWPATYALLLRSVENPSDLTQPALGRMFLWDEATVGGDAELDSVDAMTGLIMESYRNESINSDVIRAREYSDMKLLNVKGAQLIKFPAAD